MNTKKLLYLFPVLTAILAIGGSKAHAQVIGELKASIPFEFHAGGVTLPAGNYTISVPEGFESNVMEIRSADNHSSVLIETIDVQSGSLPKNSELLFDHTGDEYYLARIFDHDDKSGVAVIDPDYTKKYKGTLPPADQKHIALVYKTN